MFRILVYNVVLGFFLSISGFIVAPFSSAATAEISSAITPRSVNSTLGLCADGFVLEPSLLEKAQDWINELRREIHEPPHQSMTYRWNEDDFQILDHFSWISSEAPPESLALGNDKYTLLLTAMVQAAHTYWERPRTKKEWVDKYGEELGRLAFAAAFFKDFRRSVEADDFIVTFEPKIEHYEPAFFSKFLPKGTVPLRRVRSFKVMLLSRISYKFRNQSDDESALLPLEKGPAGPIFNFADNPMTQGFVEISRNMSLGPENPTVLAQHNAQLFEAILKRTVGVDRNQIAIVASAHDAANKRRLENDWGMSSHPPTNLPGPVNMPINMSGTLAVAFQKMGSRNQELFERFLKTHETALTSRPKQLQPFHKYMGPPRIANFEIPAGYFDTGIAEITLMAKRTLGLFGRSDGPQLDIRIQTEDIDSIPIRNLKKSFRIEPRAFYPGRSNPIGAMILGRSILAGDGYEGFRSGRPFTAPNTRVVPFDRLVVQVEGQALVKGVWLPLVIEINHPFMSEGRLHLRKSAGDDTENEVQRKLQNNLDLDVLLEPGSRENSYTGVRSYMTTRGSGRNLRRTYNSLEAVSLGITNLVVFPQLLEGPGRPGGAIAAKFFAEFYKRHPTTITLDGQPIVGFRGQGLLPDFVHFPFTVRGAFTGMRSLSDILTAPGFPSGDPHSAPTPASALATILEAVDNLVLSQRDAAFILEASGYSNVGPE